MNINLSYEAFIRSFQLFYIGKLQMSDTNAKTTNRRIQYNEFISVTDNAVKKLKQKLFRITVIRKIYSLRSQFHKCSNRSLREQLMHWYILALVLSLRFYSLILRYQNRYR